MTEFPGPIARVQALVVLGLLLPAIARAAETAVDASEPWGAEQSAWRAEPLPGAPKVLTAERTWPEFAAYRAPGAIGGADEAGPAGSDPVPLTLTLGDLDGDRRSDLVVTYRTANGGGLALLRGNPESHLYRNQEETPFLSPAAWFGLPVAPDFVAIGDFNDDGHADVAASAMGGDAVYLLAGEGDGTLGGPEAIWLGGPVTAAAVGEVNRRDGVLDLVFAVNAANGAELQVFQNRRGTLNRAPERIAVPVVVDRVLLGSFDRGSERDIAAIGGDELFLVSGRQPAARGRDKSAAPITPDRIELPFAVAAGTVTVHRELALWSHRGERVTGSPEALATGDYHIVGGSGTGPSGALSGQFSHQSGRELLQWRDNGVALAAAGSGSNQALELELPGTIRAVAADYLDGDGLMDLVVLTAESAQPMVLLSHKGGGFDVNSLGDGSDSDIGDDICDIQSPAMPPPNNICTLRAAIQEATAPASMGGTITASVPGVVTLGSNLPPITKPLTIMGGNMLEVTGTGVANTAFRVVSGGQLTLSGMSAYLSVAVVIQSSFAGPVIADNVIRDNNFGVTHGDALMQDASTTIVDSTDNLFENNLVNGSVFIRGARSANNTVSGNTLASESGDPETGFFVVSVNESPDSTIFDNLLTGISVNDNANGTGDVLIQANQVGVDSTGTMVGNAGSGVLGITVRGTGAAGITVDSNEVAGQTGTGIAAGGDRPVVRFNSSHDNGNDGFGISGDQALVVDNVAQENDGKGMDVLATNSQVIGNQLLDNGTLSGTANFRAVLSGNLVEANVMTGGSGPGAQLTGGGPSPDAALFINNVVDGNGVGIRVSALHDARIADNSVKNNLGHGVEIQNFFQTINLELQRNEITGNTGHGIRILGGQGAKIGGSGGDGNTITGNDNAGISVSISASGYDIGGNSIHDNGDLGIDLNANGLPEINDTGDGDAGGNDLQNFPVITNAAGGILGILNSTPNRSFRIDAYGNGACDSSGFGEGRSFLGSTTVTTDGNGNANISMNVAAQVVTLTATDLTTSSTSEFSDCRADTTSMIVNSDGDLGDAIPGNGDCFTGQMNNDGDPECTLRAAIEEANDQPGYSTIVFNIPPSHGLIIQPPTLFDALSEGVNIDATTQPTGMVVVDGSLQPGTSIGLQLLGDGSIVRGLGVTGFVKGVVLTDAAMGKIEHNRFTLNSLALSLEGLDSTGNLVRLNEFDIAMSGGAPAGNGTAVRIFNAPNNTVSGNTFLGSGVGVQVTGTSAAGNSVSFNEFGIRSADNTVAGNDIGVAVDNAPSTIIGNNVIVAGDIEGINVDGSQAAETLIQGNLIGTDHRRLPGLGHGERGISVTDAPRTRIGGQIAVDQNVIVGNGIGGSMKGGPPPDLDGILLVNADGTVVEGNYIGITDTGVAMGNGRDGVNLVDSSDVIIGGPQAASRNVISANGVNGSGVGIFIAEAGSVDVLVAGNYIGVGIDGSTPAGNADEGIAIFRAGPNRIEGDPDNYPQVISSNGFDGIAIGFNELPPAAESPFLGQIIRGNIIGSDASGSFARANGGHGVFVTESANNLIEDNLISANNGDGIAFDDASGKTLFLASQVVGNRIGVTQGGFPLGNLGHGISSAGTSDVLIGNRNDPAASNLIAFNALDGINLSDFAGGPIEANRIFSNGRLGINLASDGEPAGTVTPNDPLDGDDGPNRLTNFPQNVNVSVVANTDIHIIRGIVSTYPNSKVSVEFFDSDLCDPKGNGEGQRFLGFVDGLETDGNGIANFVGVFQQPLQVVTTTLRVSGGLFFLSTSSEFSACAPVPPPAGELLINEVNAVSGGLEFIELFHTAGGVQSLAGHTVVLYDGDTDLSYAAFDLDGLFTDVNGYFVLGDGADPAVDLAIPAGILQDGADAIALYQADATDFPDGTPVTTDDLVDALVYDTGQADDDGLLTLLNEFQPQVDESGAGDLANHSNQRCPNGAGGQRNTDLYAQAAPTPKAENACVICTLTPSSAGRDVAEQHTVTAAVLENRVIPLPAVNVAFAVTDGPALGANGNGTTTADGTADFSLASAGVGIDTITASGMAAGNPFACSATVQWTSEVVFASGFESTPQP